MYVTHELIELLSVQASYAWWEEGWLFGVGVLVNRNSAGRPWRQARYKVGMEKFTLHDLPRFYASA